MLTKILITFAVLALAASTTLVVIVLTGQPDASNEHVDAFASSDRDREWSSEGSPDKDVKSPTTAPPTTYLQPDSTTTTSLREIPEMLPVVGTTASNSRDGANLRCTGERISYGPEQLVDGDENTGWGASRGDGVGQWVDVDLGRPVTLTQISITPGYTREGPRMDTDCQIVPAFQFNRILKTVTYQFDDGSSAVHQLPPEPGLQTLDLDVGVVTSHVRIVLGETFRPPGADDDTVISEAAFVGIP